MLSPREPEISRGRYWRSGGVKHGELCTLCTVGLKSMSGILKYYRNKGVFSPGNQKLVEGVTGGQEG